VQPSARPGAQFKALPEIAPSTPQVRLEDGQHCQNQLDLSHSDASFRPREMSFRKSVKRPRVFFSADVGLRNLLRPKLVSATPHQATAVRHSLRITKQNGPKAVQVLVLRAVGSRRSPDCFRSNQLPTRIHSIAGSPAIDAGCHACRDCTPGQTPGRQIYTGQMYGILRQSASDLGFKFAFIRVYSRLNGFGFS
jgi:hypothetical protein